jgi:CRISPR/Cas system Type II protein with McrA/HNH and RuvC-like nuclease domain
MAKSHNMNSRDRRVRLRLLRKRFGDFCAYCKVRMTFQKLKARLPHYATLDHVIPFSHEFWEGKARNTVLACRRCNCGIVSRWPVEQKLQVLGRTWRDCHK